MSYERGLKAINLQPADKIAYTEMLGHPEFIQKASGIDPYKNPRKAYIEAYKSIDVDLAWLIFDEVVRFEHEGDTIEVEGGRKASQWGTSHTYGDSTRPIKEPDEMLAYDPLPDFENAYKNITLSEIERQKELQEQFGESALVPGIINRTCFHWLQEKFDMAAFMVVALTYPEEFKKLVDRFGELSYQMNIQWCNSDVKVILSHDDIALSHALFFRPEWVREYIIPWYERIWKPLKEKGIKIIYLSDGDYSLVVDDIARAGADGLFFESVVDLEMMTNKFGGKKVLVGNINTSILTVGTKEEITMEVARCIQAAGKYPGYVFCASGNLPQNIPLENLEHYFREVAQLRKR